MKGLAGGRPLVAARSRGAVLIVLVAMVAMGVLYFLTAHLEAVSSYQREAREASGSGNSIELAREALLGYAATYRDNNSNEVFGYLPCPDTTGDGVADAVLSAAECGSAGHAAVGLLPYRTLGLPDLRDTDGNCLWYAVSSSFKAAATKPTPMNWDTQGQFSVTDANSASLVVPGDSNGGAAAVIFASGVPVTDQSRGVSSSGPCQVDPTQVTAYLDGAYTFASSSTIPLTQGPLTNANGTVTNNDRLALVTPKQIFERIKKRSDLVTAINTLSSSLVTSLTPTAAGASLVTHDAGTETAIGSTKLVGKFPAATAVSPASYLNYRDNWRDMYRYVRCLPSSPTNKCLTVNGQNCMGTLVFAGERAAAGPRTTAQQSADATYIDGYVDGANDTGNYLAYSATTSDTFSGASSFSIANATQPVTSDVLYCLNSPDQTVISGTGGFSATAGSSALVSSLDSSGRLGTASVSASNRSGCTWYPTAVDFLNGLSVYFTMTITTRDAGIAFVLADATNNTSTVNLCGGIGTNSRYLGYAGTHSSGNWIKPPKIGLELDTRVDSTVGAPDAGLASRHASLVYWGTTATNNDDNTHGAGTGSNTEPLNPGVVTQTFANGSVYHVRLDIQRAYTAPLGTYTVNAYIYMTGTSLSCTAFIADLNDDASNHCTATISNTITIDDSVTSGNEAMKKVLLGFTTGQRAGVQQNITIGNFAAQNH